MTFFRWGSRNAGRPERKSLFGLSLADPCSTLSLREASRFPSEIGNRESRAPLRVQGGIALTNRTFKINTLTCPHVLHYVLRKSVRIIVRGHERTEQTRTHTHTHTHKCRRQKPRGRHWAVAAPCSEPPTANSSTRSGSNSRHGFLWDMHRPSPGDAHMLAKKVLSEAASRNTTQLHQNFIRAPFLSRSFSKRTTASLHKLSTA